LKRHIVLDPDLGRSGHVHTVVPLVVDTEKYSACLVVLSMAMCRLKQVLNEKGMSQAQIGQ
jgi:hypothetical protein